MCTWIVELKLNEINNSMTRAENDTDKDTQLETNKAIQLMKDDFHRFLIDNREDVHQDTVF